MSLYLDGGIFIDPFTLEFNESIIKVGKGESGGIEFTKTIPDGAEVLNCRDKIITRSFVNSHHHIYSTLARGMPPPVRNPADFFEILKFIWWKLDKSLTSEMIEISALISAIESIRNGVTFVIDHHSSPFSVKGSLLAITKAFSSAGISCLPCYEMSDRDGDKVRGNAIEETENYLMSGKPALTGLHASFTVSDELLGKSVKLAKKYDSGIHIHAAEDMIDQKVTKKKFGRSVIQRMNDSGILDMDKSILAHCIHIDKEERKLLKNSKAWVVQNAESNLNNGVGIFNPEGIGERVLLGTDGMNSNMINSARSAFLSGNFSGGNSPEMIYRRLRKNHQYLRDNGFKGDGNNNLVIFDYKPPTELTENNFCSHFIYGLKGSDVSSVISRGNIVMKEGKVLNIDEKNIYSISRELSRSLWDKMGKS
ncbi:MAG: amidohydrolase family protein [Acidobacteriota bacterium]